MIVKAEKAEISFGKTSNLTVLGHYAMRGGKLVKVDASAIIKPLPKAPV